MAEPAGIRVRSRTHAGVRGMHGFMQDTPSPVNGIKWCRERYIRADICRMAPRRRRIAAVAIAAIGIGGGIDARKRDSNHVIAAGLQTGGDPWSIGHRTRCTKIMREGRERAGRDGSGRESGQRFYHHAVGIEYPLMNTGCLLWGTTGIGAQSLEAAFGLRGS